MKSLKNAVYIGSQNRESLVDLSVPPHFNGNLLVFIHGFMGFKDWGAWNLMESYFFNLGYGFCKFNLSHNGGTVENGIDFPDLESFANDTYSKQKEDVKLILNWLETKMDSMPKIHLIGHSRGGGIALLNLPDKRVSSVITLAGICSIERRFRDSKVLEEWIKDGVRYTENQRTHQKMPHNIIQYEDFVVNKENLDIEKVCLENQKPVLIIHGDSDTSIFIEEAESLAKWTKSEVKIIAGADHVFGASHPWKSDEMPVLLKEVCEVVEGFLKGQ
ncbi:MAG: alpha/beta hydrolase [Crocinitomicaceae bacterium]|nr:alpha/beta hydrolase [Crocinitomicaceae bacterium]